jgi:hypothetical protein
MNIPLFSSYHSYLFMARENNLNYEKSRIAHHGSRRQMNEKHSSNNPGAGAFIAAGSGSA